MTHTRTLVAVVLLLLAACGSPVEKAANYIAKAQARYDAGDLVQARLEAQNAVQVEPRNAKARYLLALIAEQDKDWKSMYGHLIVVVDEDPTNVEARLKLARLHFVTGAWNEAGEQSKALLKLAPKDSRVALLGARIDLHNGNLPAARDGLAKSLELDPDNIEALLLASAVEASENLDKGLATLDAAIQRMPADKSRLLREGRIGMLIQGQRLDEAEQGLVALSKDFPDNADYPAQLAGLYVSQGRSDEAEQLLERVTELDPKNQQRRLDYVQFLLAQRDPAKAEAVLKKFIAAQPEADKLRLALGNLYESTERLPEAKSTFQVVAARSAKSRDGLAARNRIAVIEFKQGNGAKALAVLDEILADVPDDSSALLLRGFNRFQRQEFDDAIADLRTMLRKDPANEPAMLLLAQAHLAKKEPLVAKDVYRRLLTVRPDSERGLSELVRLYVSEKDFAAAEQVLRDRLQARPNDPVASGSLIDLLLLQGQKAKAEEEARRMAALPNQAGFGDLAVGRVLLAEKQDYDAAADSFRKSLAAGANDRLAMQGLVQSLSAAGKKQEAIAALKEIEAGGGPERQEFSRLLLADLYAQGNDRANAEKLLEKVIQTRPDTAAAYAALARLNAQDPAAQIRVLQRGLKVLPADPELNLLLGSALEASGQVDQALAVYTDLVKANPGYLPGVNNLAAALLDFRTDTPSLQRALQLTKSLEAATDPTYLDTVGWAHYRAGNHARAVSVLEQVVAKDAPAPVYRYHLGMAYLAVGNETGAKQQLEQAVVAGANYTGIEEARAAKAKLDKSG